jgi:hypothetical protein
MKREWADRIRWMTVGIGWDIARRLSKNQNENQVRI